MGFPASRSIASLSATLLIRDLESFQEVFRNAGPEEAIMFVPSERKEGGGMRRCGCGLVILTMAVAYGSACRTRTDVPSPVVTAKGSAGDEDVPDLAIRHVTLKAGETLLVTCNDEGSDAEITWGGTALHGDAGANGSGFSTSIFTLYSAAGGTGDIVASHQSAGDLTINAYSITGLAPSAFDKTAAAQGSSTSPSSGATATTSHANEFLWAAIGFSTIARPTGTWVGGFTSGGQFTKTGAGGISGVEDGYKTVSATGAYTAAKTGVDKDAWAAVIATYATAAGR
jgi:hypothetical protein